jgi:hypothetical protein
MQAPKEKLRVEIYTTNHRIVADIYIFPGARLTDIMTAREAQSFLALTGVEAYGLGDGKKLFQSDFANINKNHIVLIRPAEIPAERFQAPSF